MKPAVLNRRPALPDPEIDQILAGEEELLPSSGFLSAVMERVEAEAELPAPIPFPWRMVLPGIVLSLAALLWMLYLALQPVLTTLRQTHLNVLFSAPESTNNLSLWLVGGFLAAFFGWHALRRISHNGL
jgi:hypothetical protein